MRGGLTGRHSGLRHDAIGSANCDAGVAQDPPTLVRERDMRAIAFEEAHEMEGFSRRVRITAGNVAQLRLVRELVWPPRPLVLLCFLSHKAARLFGPVALGAMLIASGP